MTTTAHAQQQRIEQRRREQEQTTAAQREKLLDTILYHIAFIDQATDVEHWHQIDPPIEHTYTIRPDGDLITATVTVNTCPHIELDTVKCTLTAYETGTPPMTRGYVDTIGIDDYYAELYNSDR